MRTEGPGRPWNSLSEDEIAGSLVESLWHAPIALALFDRDLRIIRVNAAMADLNGLEAAAHLGKRLPEVVPGLGENSETPLREVLESGKPILNVPYAGTTAAIPGETRHWLGSVFPLRDRAGEPLGVSVVVHEISALKRQEEEARRARAEAEHALGRLERLQQVGSTLANAITPMQVAQVVLEVGRQLLGASAGAISAFGAVDPVDPVDPAASDRRRHRILDRFGFTDDFFARWRSASEERPAPQFDALRTRNALWLESDAELERLYPAFHQRVGPLPYAAAVIVPLVVEGAALGLLSFAYAAPRRFDADDRAFLLGLAGQCAQALRRARLFEAEQLQRRRAEESAVLLDTFVAAAPCGLVFLDPQLRYRMLNPALAAINGLPVAEHLGRSADELLLHQGALNALREVRESREPLENLTITAETALPGASPRSWLASFYPVSAPDGALLGVGAAIVEVTCLREAERERERLLAELRSASREREDSAALFDLLFDAAPMGFALLDRELRFVRVNRAFAEMGGERGVELFARKSAPELFASPHGERLEAEWRRVLESGEPVLDQELSGEDCGRRWAFLGSWFPVRSGEQSIGVGLIVRDLSAQRVADEFQRHLLGIVGHDLRSPLAAIVASAASLLRAEGLGARERCRLDRIQSSAGRIERMIRDLLDFTQVRAGQGIPLAPRPAELGEICLQAIDEAEAAHPGSKIDYSGSGDGGGDWDADRIGQILSNLLTNALEHGDGRVVLRWRGEAEQVLLEVSNGGEPIAPERLPDLFEPLCPGSHRGGGIGLGLFIAQQIARAHGGGIEARSDEVATVFTTRLPRRRASCPPPG